MNKNIIENAVGSVEIENEHQKSLTIEEKQQLQNMINQKDIEGAESFLLNIVKEINKQKENREFDEKKHR